MTFCLFTTICLTSLGLLPLTLNLFRKETIRTISPVISKEFWANTGKVLPVSTGQGFKYNHLTVFCGLPKERFKVLICVKLIAQSYQRGSILFTIKLPNLNVAILMTLLSNVLPILIWMQCWSEPCFARVSWRFLC